MDDGHVSEKFSALSDGLLSADEKKAVEAHLASCESCRAEWEAFDRAVRAVRHLPLVEPPVALRTAKDTPTSEKAKAAGASTRSASSSRKSRIARTGSRRVRSDRRPRTARANTKMLPIIDWIGRQDFQRIRAGGPAGTGFPLFRPAPAGGAG